MRTFIIAIFLLVAGVLTAEVCPAQTNYGFTYDANGNRTLRSVIILKSATIHPDSLQAKQDIKPLDDKVGLQKTIIYPNPTKGILRIDFPELTGQQPIIRAYDQSGRLIVQKTALSYGNEIDLSANPPGFYMMVIQIGQERKDWKIIKE